MATRMGWTKKNWMTPSDWPTKNPSLVQKSRTYLKYELSCGTFCVQFSKIFHTVATWVSLKQIPFTRLNWPIPKTPFGARILVISHIQLLFSEPEDDWHAECRVVQESLANAKVSATEVRLLRPLAKKCTANTMMKSTLSGFQRCRWQYGSILIRLAVVASKICEIPRNSP